MAFSDPQALTVSGTTATSLFETFREGFRTVYSNTEGTLKLAIFHVFGRRNRHNVRDDFAKIAIDPISGFNSRVTGSVYLVIDVPKDGFTNDEIKGHVLGLSKWCSDASGANVDRLLGGQS